jgi:uncharacterized membrane protein HdeD (DUF308 family)
MEDNNKSDKLLGTARHPDEAENWMFSLIPVVVAFAFYIFFILNSDIAEKNLFIAFGAAAGFVGLETYWIVRGWRKNHGSTVLMGFLGIAATVGILYFYLSIL